MEPNLKALMCPFGIYHENTSAKWLAWKFSPFFQVNGGMALQKGLANLCMPTVRQPNKRLGGLFFVKVLFSSTDFNLFWR